MGWLCNWRAHRPAPLVALLVFLEAVLTNSLGRNFPAVIGTGVFAGATLATVSYAGGQVYATGETPEERLSRKEEHRRRFRRPYQEMVNEIGEGRGMYLRPSAFDTS